MLCLLNECTRSGYPPDYLMARIRGSLDGYVAGAQTDGSTFQADDAVIWDAAVKARRWIYLQMESNLREALAPLFIHFELRTMILCLRILEGKQDDSKMINLTQSLLAEGIKKMFLSPALPVEVLGKVEKFMRNSVLAMDGLVTSYVEGGMQGCEKFVRKQFLERVVVVSGCPEVVGLFRKIIDQKNIVTLAKSLRWKIDSSSGLISGGYLRMRKADQLPTQATLEKMVQRFTGGSRVTAAELHPLNLEPLLHDHLAHTVAGRVRSGDPVECCMGYIWQTFVVARKRSEKYHAGRFTEYFPAGSESFQ